VRTLETRTEAPADALNAAAKGSTIHRTGGYTPLHSAVSVLNDDAGDCPSNWFAAMLKANKPLQTLRALLKQHENGLNLSARDSDGCTPLMLAAACGSFSGVKLLLKHLTLRETRKGEQTDSSFTFAKLEAQLDCGDGRACGVPIQHCEPSELEARSAKGLSALHFAAKGLHIGAATELLAAGADPTALDGGGRSAEAHAAEQKQQHLKARQEQMLQLLRAKSQEWRQAAEAEGLEAMLSVE